MISRSTSKVGRNCTALFWQDKWRHCCTFVNYFCIINYFLLLGLKWLVILFTPMLQLGHYQKRKYTTQTNTCVCSKYPKENCLLFKTKMPARVWVLPACIITSPTDEHDTVASASFLAELSVSSPQKLFIFIIKKNIFWIKVSKKYLI